MSAEFLILESQNLTAEQKQKKWHLRGIIAKCDHMGANGRYYARHVMEQAIKDAGSQILGSLDHEDHATLSLSRAAVVVRSLDVIEDNVYATMEVLNTEQGSNLAALLESGIKVGVSSRGVGEVDRDGKVSKFRITSFDIVSKPANTGGAWMEAIYESIREKNNKAVLAQRLPKALGKPSLVNLHPEVKEGELRSTQRSRFLDPKDDNRYDSHHKNPYPSRKPKHLPIRKSKVKLEHAEYVRASQLLERSFTHHDLRNRLSAEMDFHRAMTRAANTMSRRDPLFMDMRGLGETWYRHREKQKQMMKRYADSMKMESISQHGQQRGQPLTELYNIKDKDGNPNDPQTAPKFRGLMALLSEGQRHPPMGN